MKSLTEFKKFGLRLAILLILAVPVASETALSRADFAGTWSIIRSPAGGLTMVGLEGALTVVPPNWLESPRVACCAMLSSSSEL